MFKSVALSAVLCVFCRVALAQYQFSVPDPDQNDLSESWSVGEKMEIAWQQGWKGVGDALDSADLWITWFRSDSYSQLLLEGVTFNNKGTFSWVVNVTNDVVRRDPQFVLRLKPHSDPPIYTSTENESPSRGFLLLPGNDPFSSSTAASLTATSSVPSSIASSTITSTATGTPSDRSMDGGSSTNVGAIVGGVVGGLAGIALIIVAAWLCLRRRKRLQENAYESGPAVAGAPAHVVKEYYGLRAEPVEMAGKERPAELSGGFGGLHEMNENSMESRHR